MTAILFGTAVIVGLVLVLTAIVMGARALLSPSRPVAISVNGATTVNGLTGRKLLSILNDGGIPVPSACAGAGTCGLCKVRVGEGGGAPLPTETARLGRADLAAGQRLACQVVVRGPLAVTVPDDILSAESWTSRVVSTRMVAPLIREIVLDVPDGVDFTFRAGSYVQVEAPPHHVRFASMALDPAFAGVWETMGLARLESRSQEPVRRAYSVASRPEDTGRIVLNIRLALPPPGSEDHVPPGIVSSWLFGLAEGDPVEISGPFGEFHVQETGREMIFIGGGVGMAPLRAMIHEQLAAGTTRRMSFWYGARGQADIFYRDEFDALAARHPNFTWTLALSEPLPQPRWEGATGFVHEVVLRDHLAGHPAPEECEYYLCGPPLMIEAVLAMLEEAGVEPASIFNDDFGV